MITPDSAASNHMAPNPAAPNPAASTPEPRRVLVTGATGYIGSRLIPRLLRDGHHVRAAVTNLERARTAWPNAAFSAAGWSSTSTTSM